MKKYLMTMALMAVVAVAGAQNEPGTLTIQPKGGFGLATLTNATGAEMTGVGMFGGELEYAMNEKWSLAAGLNFNMQGYGIDDVGNVEDWQTGLSYLAVPAVANLYIYKGLALKAGLQPGLLLHANETYKQNGEKYDIKVKDHYKSFDLAVPLGVSFEFSRVVIDARYLLGLTKVNKYGGKTCRNSVILITTGYKFNL